MPTAKKQKNLPECLKRVKLAKEVLEGKNPKIPKPKFTPKPMRGRFFY